MNGVKQSKRHMRCDVARSAGDVFEVPPLSPQKWKRVRFKKKSTCAVHVIISTFCLPLTITISDCSRHGDTVGLPEQH